MDAAIEVLGRPASELSVYEFGVGSDLIGPLTFLARGVRRQVVVDQSPLLRPRLVESALRRFGDPRQSVTLPVPPRLDCRSRRHLVHHLATVGIDYRAPVDARATGLPSASMDLIVSNSTMEHVPRSDLPALVAECMRLLKPSGVMSFRIDYEDHYAIHDRSLSSYNFLRFSDREWRKYNSALQYQNRLRHSDYVSLFERLGLDTLAVETLDPSPAHLAELATMPLHDSFRAYALPDLGIRKGVFLLRKLPA